MSFSTHPDPIFAASAIALAGSALRRVAGAGHTNSFWRLYQPWAGTCWGFLFWHRARMPGGIALVASFCWRRPPGYFLFALITNISTTLPGVRASHFDEATTHRWPRIRHGHDVCAAIHCTVGWAGAWRRDSKSHADGHVHHVAICVHKFPEGLALGALLLGGGVQRAKNAVACAAWRSMTVVGGLLAGCLRNASEFWLALALANAAGGFLYLALHAVLGEISSTQGLVLEIRRRFRRRLGFDFFFHSQG